jgi:iron complex outermembrane receptor protein
VPVDLNGNGTTSDKNILTYTPSITQTFRSGITNKLTYVVDNHRLNVGYWFEWANHHQFGTLTALDGSSNPFDAFGMNGAARIVSGNLAGQQPMKRDITTYTTTHVLFAGDTVSMFNDRLNLDLGVKQAFVTRNQEQRMPGATPNLTISNTETLPSGALRWRPDDQNLFFGSVATNFRTPPNFTMQDSFSLTTGALTQRGNNSARVETSLVEEIGWRYNGEKVLGSITAFHYDFWNRQVSTNVLDPANPQSGVLIASAFNAGRTRAQGVDIEVGTRPIYNFRPYASFEYLNTEILSNYAVQGTNAAGQKVGDYLRTAGKAVPQSPRYTAGIGLAYDDGTFFGNAVVKRVDRQAATFTNDQWMKEYTRLDLGAGVYLPDMGAIRSPMLRLNMQNVTNVRSLVGVNGVQVSSRTLAGVHGSTVASQGTPTYYLGNGFAALVTLSAPFSFQ